MNIERFFLVWHALAFFTFTVMAFYYWWKWTTTEEEEEKQRHFLTWITLLVLMNVSA
jgi:hypothetical protein